MARLLPVSPPLGDGLTFSVWSLKRVTTQKMVEIKGFKEFLKEISFFFVKMLVTGRLLCDFFFFFVLRFFKPLSGVVWLVGVFCTWEKLILDG